MEFDETSVPITISRVVIPPCAIEMTSDIAGSKAECHQQNINVIFPDNIVHANFAAK